MTHLVVTGTDTGIGKTVFAAALTVALGAHYWKPVQSGLEDDTDSHIVGQLGVPADHIHPEAYRLRAPLSPHEAAAQDKIEIDATRLNPPRAENMVIEGAGGLLVPLNATTLFADLFACWQWPVILCARTALGTINHTLLSIEALHARGIPLRGIAFMGEEHAETQRIIAHFSGSCVLGRLPRLPVLNAHTLGQAFATHFNVQDFQDTAS